MATIRDTDLLYVQRGETPHNWTGLELKSLVSSSAKDGKLTVGQYLTPNAQQYDGSGNLTINVDATSTSTANKVVVRDNSGNFAGNVITASSFVGDGLNLTNTGPTLSVASGSQRLVMTTLTSGKMITGATDSGLAWDASGQLTVDGAGSFTGNVTAALFEGPVSGDVTGNVTGNLTGDVEGNITGNLTGNITGDVTGNADSATKLETARSINGTNFDGTADITTVKWGTARSMNGVSVDGSTSYTLEPYVERDDSSNAARYLTFVDDGTAGYKRLNVDNGLSYNPSTNRLSGTIDNADTVDGYHADEAATASTVVVRNGDGDLFGRYVNVNHAASTRTGDTVFYSSTDDYIRKTDAAGMRSSLNVPTRTGGDASGTWNINITGSAGSSSGVTINYNNDSNSTYQMLWGNGNSVYGTSGIYCNPSSDTLYATNFNSLSDISLKENIRIVEDPLTILKDIEGVKFDWKETGKSTLGVVAQNVETVLPELIDENDEGIKSVNYSGLISVLIEAVKEQQKQIDELKKLCQK